MVSFFSENYYAYHYSSPFSLAFFYVLICILFIIFLPFFTNIGTLEIFWKPKVVYTDHPIIQFKDEFVFFVTYQKTGSSSIAELSPIKTFDENIILSLSEFQCEEYGDTDIYNKIKYKGYISTSEDVSIKSIKLYFFFDYYLIEDAFILLKTNVHIGYSLKDSSESINKLSSFGTLELVQNKALSDNYFIQSDNFQEKNLKEKITDLEVDVGSDENYINYKKDYIFIEKGNESRRRIELDISMDIPYYQNIIVELPHFTNLKNKWVIYSILFYPTLYICYSLVKFTFKNQIFKTSIKSELPIKL